MSDIEYIKTQDALAEFCRHASQEDWIAVDTEFLREKTYFAKLCLIQIAAGNRIACIDPLAIDDMAALKTVLDAPSPVKVLHSPSQDIEVLYQTLGVRLGGVFDTQLAASFCGLGDQMGYAKLTQTLTGVTLAKAYSRADWSKRPIAMEMFDYAADDVRYLGALYDELSARMKAKGYWSWFEDEMVALAARFTRAADVANIWQRVRGWQQLNTASARGVLKSLAAWRERRAIDVDKPRRWVLADEALLALAEQQPRSTYDLADLHAGHQPVKRGCAQAVVDAVLEGLAAPVEVEMSPAPDPAHHRLGGKLAGIVRAEAKQLQISPTLLASRKQLDRIAAGHRNEAVLTGWRYDLIGRALLDALEQEADAAAEIS